MIGQVALLLAIQLQSPAESSYSSERLRAVVSELAAANRDVPALLVGYSAHVQAEAALLRVDGALSERLMSVQQLALRVAWTRDGRYREHAIGIRGESRTLLAYDALALPSFTVPVLYGNRLDLLLGPYTGGESAGDAANGKEVAELHPLAEGRDRIYAYEGGETSERWVIGGRELSIGRIGVSVRAPPAARTTVFEGELFFDVSRRQLVALRGVIKEIGGRSGTASWVLERAVRVVGRIEIVMSERQGEYWLPFSQRIELQVKSAFAGREMIVLRISSRFSDVELAVRPARDSLLSSNDALSAFVRRISVASADSLDLFSQWRQPLGVATSSAMFEQIRPPNDPEEPLRSTTGPRFGTQRLRESIRFNRVEGIFTGAGVIVPFQSSAGHGTLAATLGRAWAERAWRGHLDLALSSAKFRVGTRVGADIESTNDFYYPADNAAILLSPLFTRDDQDYLERRAGTVYLERIGSRRVQSLRLEVARVSDRPVARTLRYGLFHGDSGFRANRPISPGDFTRASLTASVNPDVLAEYLRPGVGFWGRAETSWGDIGYGRIEARLGYRRVVLGSLAIAARVDAGMLAASRSIPLQQMFELGGPAQLPGFAYKSSAGDRAALGMLALSLPLPLPSGMRDLPRLLRPRLAAHLYFGIATASTEDVAAAVSVLEMAAPTCGATDACRPGTSRSASAQLGLRFFEGALFVGATRRTSEPDRWRFALSATVF